eukprot:Pompholyxophrys_sp_v1_NODE_125_length_1742_cov_3.723770.p2 type:complete len:129 gc:universal NODE_125_length_1742_cov_3.723770:519-133(-)
MDLPAEYMHGLSGTMKKLFHLWFDSSHHREDWYMGRAINEIDRRLLTLSPPSWMTRPPRAISNDLSYWKASEYVNFVVYHGPYVLSDLLPEPYYKHFMLLHYAMRTMLGSRIATANLFMANTQCGIFK